jgi:DNA-directed RNA polymerase subunit M/transcription elongation factor TFIIS
MEFCDVCNNMLYMRCNEDNNLVKYCKHCDFEKVEINKGSVKISETIYTEDDLLYNQNINKYLRYDQTLRRINDPQIKCPNSECITSSAENVDQQVIYIKYHPRNMKYLYVCDHCGYIWR